MKGGNEGMMEGVREGRRERMKEVGNDEGWLGRKSGRKE